MTDTSAALAILAGLGLRLAAPIFITVLVVLALARLDRGWRREADSASALVPKPECWKTQGCPPARRKDCPGYNSALPCWQVFRLGNGYLNQKCLGCPVLVGAPVPNRA